MPRAPAAALAIAALALAALAAGPAQALDPLADAQGFVDPAKAYAQGLVPAVCRIACDLLEMDELGDEINACKSDLASCPAQVPAIMDFAREKLAEAPGCEACGSLVDDTGALAAAEVAQAQRVAGELAACAGDPLGS